MASRLLHAYVCVRTGLFVSAHAEPDFWEHFSEFLGSCLGTTRKPNRHSKAISVSEGRMPSVHHSSGRPINRHHNERRGFDDHTDEHVSENWGANKLWEKEYGFLSAHSRKYDSFRSNDSDDEDLVSHRGSTDRRLNTRRDPSW